MVINYTTISPLVADASKKTASLLRQDVPGQAGTPDTRNLRLT